MAASTAFGEAYRASVYPHKRESGREEDGEQDTHNDADGDIGVLHGRAPHQPTGGLATADGE